MVKVAKLIGGAGTGKTTELLRILSDVIDRGVDPYDVGFVSFTRAARAEAAERVASEFGVDAEQLQSNGWFRTLHSVCYKGLGGRLGDGMITGTKADKEWIDEVMGEPCEGFVSSGPAEDRQESAEEPSKAVKALRIWDLARNRLTSIEDVHKEAKKCGDMLPSLEYCVGIAKRYERAKWRDDRLDFVDLAGRYAGWIWNPEGEPGCGTPEGTTPDVPVWIFDEHQDVSRLLDSVAARLASAPGVRWVYYAGDPFQSIYGFSGSDARCLLDVPCDHYRVMEKSWRCPGKILELGERILRPCVDYFDRKIQPNEPGGVVSRTWTIQSAIQKIKPEESWLFISRTNYTAARLKGALSREHIPWDHTRGEGGYATPTIRMVSGLLYDLQKGLSITSDDWEAVLRHLPAGRGEGAFLQRGVKTQVIAGDYGIENRPIRLKHITELGATELLRSVIESGQWTKHINGSDAYVSALRKWGRDLADFPRVRVGTIHSVKGSEADNVVVLNSISKRVARGRRTTEGRDAERRIAYVAATRARKNLWILGQKSDQYRMEI